MMIKKAQVAEEIQTVTDWDKSGMKNQSVLNPEVSCVARSVQCYYNQGHNNFRILTLYIEKGKVVKMDLSDAYAQWEALQKMEHWNSGSLFHLNQNWSNGKCITR